MKTPVLLQPPPAAIRPRTTLAARAGLLQRLSAHRSSVDSHPSDVPPIVHEVLRSPGHSLDSGTRAFFEPRFGHNFSNVPVRVPARHSVSRLSVGPADDYYEQQADLVAAKVMSPAPGVERRTTPAFDFSQVRVHTGPRASASAAALGAQAYAVGRDIVFGEGKFSPDTSGGRRILAHELTHVVQQSAWAPAGQIQRLTAAEKKEDLKSERLKRDARLQRAFDNSPAMRKTEISEGVKTLQRALRDLGYPMPISFADGDADGIFEDETFATVKQFQVDHGIADEGAVGRETLRTLDEMFSTSLTLKAVRFTSDHGLMKDNQASWDGAGPAFAKPEWTSAIPNTKSAPISHTKNQAVKVDITLDVAPETVTRVPVNLKGQSALSFLTFNVSGSVSGGKDRVLSATSAGLIPDAVDDQYQKQTIDWSAEVIGENQVLGQSLEHGVFVTYDTPVGGGVTHKRMAKATELTKGFGNKPHDIVSGEMKRFPSYNLKKPYSGNIWPLADDITSSAECQAIVRFVQAVNDMVGVPGTAIGIAVYANPTSPSVPIVALLVASGGATGSMSDFPADPQGRKAYLFDSAGLANNYEAALEFDFGGKLYYPGGVPGGRGVATTLDVLHSFKKMSWSRWDPAANRFKAVKLIFCYHPPC